MSRTLSDRSSARVKWIDRGEKFGTLWGLSFDVGGAKAILRVHPRRIESIPLRPLARQITRGSINLRRRSRVRKLTVADLAVPVIRVPFRGRLVVIDGWHRIAARHALKLDTIPAVTLTPQETACIIMRKRR